MKAKYLFLALLLLPIAFSSTEVSVSSLSVSRQSISSGESGAISFIITNTGDKSLSEVEVSLSSSLTLGRTLFTFNDLDVGESRTITTSYSAPSDMKSGSYPINIDIKYDVSDEEYHNQASVVVNVAGSKYLVVSNYTTQLLIDGTTRFVINLKNEGDDDLNDLLISLSLPDGFIPLNGSQFYIDSLDVGESVSFSTDIFVDKSIEPNPYQIVVSKVADGYSDSNTLNIYAYGIPELSISGINLDPKVPIQGEMESISVQIENVGSGDAYNVVAQLYVDGGSKGRKVEYLGSLERDDLTSAIFDITVPKTDFLNGTIVITYTDNNGQLHQERQDISFDVVGVGSSNTLAYIVAGVVVVILIYYITKKRK